MRNLAITVAAFAAAACASPQTVRPVVASAALAAEQQRQSLFVLESRAADYRRVYDIAERLYHANVELCPRKTRVIGARFENLNDYGSDFREAAQALWGLGQAPTVGWIGADSAAAEAGLALRDELLSVNGRAIHPGRRSSRQAATLLREAAEVGAVTLEIRRNAQTHSISMIPRESCAYQFFVVDDDEINAAADGRTIYLNRGMLRFVRSDDELALILGHELAHNAMRHIEAANTNAMMGLIGGAILDGLAAAGGVNTGGAFSDAGGDIGRMMFSQEFESEADYVGLYFSARAGYDVSTSEMFWRRMAVESPRGIRFAYTHPNTAERYLGLAATRAELERKRSAGEPLRPNMRGEEAVAPPPVSPTEAEVAHAAPPPQEPAAGVPETAQSIAADAKSIASSPD